MPASIAPRPRLVENRLLCLEGMRANEVRWEHVRNYSVGHRPGAVLLARSVPEALPAAQVARVALLVAGAIGCVSAGQVFVMGADLGLLSVFAVALGVGLFLKRRRFVEVG